MKTDFVFANFVDASIVEVIGDHVTRRLDPELPVREGGFVLDGTRDWSGTSGDWSIEMTDLEVRPQDPAPQGGTVELVDPKGNTLTIAYERIDEDTIAATVVGRDGLRRLFHIDADGEVHPAGNSARPAARLAPPGAGAAPAGAPPPSPKKIRAPASTDASPGLQPFVTCGVTWEDRWDGGCVWGCSRGRRC